MILFIRNTSTYSTNCSLAYDKYVIEQIKYHITIEMTHTFYTNIVMTKMINEFRIECTENETRNDRLYFIKQI